MSPSNRDHLVGHRDLLRDARRPATHDLVAAPPQLRERIDRVHGVLGEQRCNGCRLVRDPCLPEVVHPPGDVRPIHAMRVNPADHAPFRAGMRWPCYPSSAPQQEAGSSPSSSGLGRCPFKAEARVRIPLGARHHQHQAPSGASAAVTTAHAPVEESGRPHLPVKEEIAGSKPVRRAR